MHNHQAKPLSKQHSSMACLVFSNSTQSCFLYTKAIGNPMGQGSTVFSNRVMPILQQGLIRVHRSQHNRSNKAKKLKCKTLPPPSHSLMTMKRHLCGAFSLGVYEQAVHVWYHTAKFFFVWIKGGTDGHCGRREVFHWLRQPYSC
jgi:hypothetical protein